MDDQLAPYRMSYRWILDKWDTVNFGKDFMFHSDSFMLPNTGAVCYMKFCKYKKSKKVSNSSYSINLMMSPPRKYCKYYISISMINRIGGIVTLLLDNEVTILSTKLTWTVVGKNSMISDYKDIERYKSSDTLTFCCDLIEIDVKACKKARFDFSALSKVRSGRPAGANESCNVKRAKIPEYVEEVVIDGTGDGDDRAPTSDRGKPATKTKKTKKRQNAEKTSAAKSQAPRKEPRNVKGKKKPEQIVPASMKDAEPEGGSRVPNKKPKRP